MDAQSLSLQNFTSIFEIFTGYYLLLGTNKRFSDYFNIAGPFRSGSENVDEIERVGSIARELGPLAVAEGNPKMKPAVSIEELETTAEDLRKVVDSHKELSRSIERFLKAARWHRRLVSHHFGNQRGNQENNDTTATMFHSFMKPFYIYFGFLSLIFLLLSGYYESWHRIHMVNLLNLLGFGAGIYLVMRAMISSFTPRVSLPQNSPVYAFIGSLFLLICSLFIPCYLFDHLFIFPYLVSEDLLSYSDCQVLAAVGLIFLPIVTQVLSLVVVVRLQSRYQRLKSAIPVDLITPPTQVIPPPSIPEL